jgi:pimeloyl-ACP methyl ester carboxylesterase
MLETPFRLRRELHWSQIKALVAAPVSFARIARRAQLIESTDIAADCRRIISPTLVVTGEQALDNIVPVESTMEYMRAIPRAAHVMLSDTGHLGSITHPMQFAETVFRFAGRPAPRTGAA